MTSGTKARVPDCAVAAEFSPNTVAAVTCVGLVRRRVVGTPTWRTIPERNAVRGLRRPSKPVLHFMPYEIPLVLQLLLETHYFPLTIALNNYVCGSEGPVAGTNHQKVESRWYAAFKF